MNRALTELGEVAHVPTRREHREHPTPAPQPLRKSALFNELVRLTLKLSPKRIEAAMRELDHRLAIPELLRVLGAVGGGREMLAFIRSMEHEPAFFEFIGGYFDALAYTLRPTGNLLRELKVI